MREAHQGRQWYREPMAWLVWGIPAVAVVSGLAMLAVATATYDGLVVDDYYKQGLSINQVKARDAEAARLGLEGELLFDAERAVAEVRLHRLPVSAASIELLLSHATLNGMDRRIVLQANSVGRWVASWAEPLAAGRWYVTVGNDEWRLSGEFEASSKGGAGPVTPLLPR